MLALAPLLFALLASPVLAEGGHFRRFGNKRHRGARIADAFHAVRDADSEKRDTCTLGAWKCVGSELQRCWGDQWHHVQDCTGDNIVCSDDPSATGCIYTWQVPSTADDASGAAATAAPSDDTSGGSAGAAVTVADPASGTEPAASALTAAGAAAASSVTMTSDATYPTVSVTGSADAADATSSLCPAGDDEYEWVEEDDDSASDGAEATSADASNSTSLCPAGDDEYEWVEVGANETSTGNSTATDDADSTDDATDEDECDDGDDADDTAEAEASLDSVTAGATAAPNSASAAAASATTDSSANATSALGADLFAGGRHRGGSSTSGGAATATIVTDGWSSALTAASTGAGGYNATSVSSTLGGTAGNTVPVTAGSTSASTASEVAVTAAVVSSYRHRGKWTTTTVGASATGTASGASSLATASASLATGTDGLNGTASGTATATAANATSTGTGGGSGGLSKFPAPHYVIYADEWLDTMPSAADLAGYNRFILAFWMVGRGGVDDAEAWMGFDAATRAAVLDAYHAAGIALMVSAFGSTDAPTSNGADPTQTAQDLATFVKTWGFDGVDIDYEDMDAMNGNTAEAWLVTFQLELRSQLGDGYLISHAPVAPWFTSASVYDQGAYVSIHRQAGDTIDFYNIQFYNQGSNMYTDCTGLISNSGSDWPSTSVLEIHSYAGVLYDKIVIGKPLDASAADNGYMDAAMLATCVKQAQAAGWNGGVMWWEWTASGGPATIKTLLAGI